MRVSQTTQSLCSHTRIRVPRSNTGIIRCLAAAAWTICEDFFVSVVFLACAVFGAMRVFVMYKVRRSNVRVRPRYICDAHREDGFARRSSVLANENTRRNRPRVCYVFVRWLCAQAPENPAAPKIASLFCVCSDGSGVRLYIVVAVEGRYIYIAIDSNGSSAKCNENDGARAVPITGRTRYTAACIRSAAKQKHHFGIRSLTHKHTHTHTYIKNDRRMCASYISRSLKWAANTFATQWHRSESINFRFMWRSTQNRKKTKPARANTHEI